MSGGARIICNKIKRKKPYSRYKMCMRNVCKSPISMSGSTPIAYARTRAREGAIIKKTILEHRWLTAPFDLG